MLLFASVAFLVLVPAGRAWPENGVAVCTAPFTQDDVSICADGAGGTFVAWVDYRNTTSEIFMQRLGPDGSPTWVPNGINVSRNAVGDLRLEMAKSSDGGVILAWSRGGGSAADITAQKVSATGSLVWPASGVDVCTAAGNQDYVCICSDGAGGAIIAWRDLRGTSNIYAQRVNASGSVAWVTNGVQVCTAAGTRSDPVICSDGYGGAIVAWDDSRNNNDVYGQRVSSTGSLLWDPNGAPIANEVGNAQKDPCICSDGAGGAIIAWQDDRSDGSGDIYAQRVLESGAGAWLANGTPVCTATEVQNGHYLAACEDGGALICWEDSRKTPYYITYVQRISGSGTVQWSANGIPVRDDQHDSLSGRVCSDGLGGAFVSWLDEPRLGPDQVSIYAQRVGPTGTMDWGTSGKCICDAPGAQEHPAITRVASGKAVIIWHDYRTGTNWDIYANQVEFVAPDDWTLTITIVVVVSIAAAVAVVLVLLYKKGKLRLPGRPAPSR